LLAAALTPALLQTNTPRSCGVGNTSLAELAVVVDDENLLAFDLHEQSYELALAPDADGCVLRAVPVDDNASVSIDLYTDTGQQSVLDDVPGGGEGAVPLRAGAYTVQVTVRSPGGAVGDYTVEMLVGTNDAVADYVWQDAEVLAPANGFKAAAGNASGALFSLWADFVDGSWDLLAARTTTDASWQTPELVTRDPEFPLEAQVAVDPTGGAMAVWRRDHRTSAGGRRYSIWASRYIAGSGWSPAELIEDDDDQDHFLPQIAVDGAGNALAVWLRRDDGIWFNRYTGGAWGSAARVEGPGAGVPRLAGDDSGRAVLVWVQLEGGTASVWSLHFEPTDGWGAPELLSKPGDHFAHLPNVAMGRDGAAIAAWHWIRPTAGGEVHSSVWSSRYTTESGWEHPLMVDRSEFGTIGEGEDERPGVAVGPNGHVFTVWLQWDSDDYPRRKPEVMASRWVPGVGWKPAEIIGPSSGNGGGIVNARNPRVVVDEWGNASFVWGQAAFVELGGSINWIWSNRYVQTVGWGAPAPITEPVDYQSQLYAEFLLAGPDGTATALWMQSDGGVNSLWTARLASP
jgi:hypothetical protein